MTTITERVAAGAAWLDEHRPGWVDRINLDTLDLGDPCRCVLGQEFGRFGAAPIAEVDNWGEETIPRGMLAAAEMDDRSRQGDLDEEYAELTDAWRDYITARRAAA